MECAMIWRGIPIKGMVLVFVLRCTLYTHVVSIIMSEAAFYVLHNDSPKLVPHFSGDINIYLQKLNLM